MHESLWLHVGNGKVDLDIPFDQYILIEQNLYVLALSAFFPDSSTFSRLAKYLGFQKVFHLLDILSSWRPAHL